MGCYVKRLEGLRNGAQKKINLIYNSEGVWCFFLLFDNSSCQSTFTTVRTYATSGSEHNNLNSYTPRTLRACCSQSKFRILKIRESSARALFLYNCTPNISHSADVSVSVA